MSIEGERGFFDGSAIMNPPAKAGDLGSSCGLGRSPGGGHDNLLQYSCLKNPMDRGAWRATVLGVSEWDLIEQLNNNNYTEEEETLSYKVQWTMLDCNILQQHAHRMSQTIKQHRVLWWRIESISLSAGEGKATYQYHCSLFFTKSQCN